MACSPRRRCVVLAILFTFFGALALSSAAMADDPPTQAEQIASLTKSTDEIKVAVDTVWVLVAAFLVFFMNLGFGLVESGLCRSKNTVNILAKNFIVFAVSTIGFWVIGWGLMFGTGDKGFFGTEGIFFVSGADNSPAMGDAYAGAYSSISWTGVPLWAKFLFQLVFCGTAATIVSGAVAERIKFSSFLIFCLLLTGLVYPIVGHLIWGGGWLGGQGMYDFAGSTVVHSVGGWAALAGVIVLGPRLGKYGKDGGVNPIPGHNLTSVMAGGLILWFGWYGFNPGSTMAAVGYADGIAHVAVTTTIAAAVATVAAAVTSWMLQGKPDFTMIVNGTLAGLVAITAPCAMVSAFSAAIIGLIGGVIVVFAVITFDKFRIDDPVGALSVHLVNGIWGTLAVGLFAQNGISSATPTDIKNGLFMGGGTEQLIPQLIGIGLAAVITFGASMVFWVVIKSTLGLRVTPQEEIEGLDLGEHDQAAYPDFQITNIKSYHIREA